MKKISDNIQANTGAVAGIEFQNNGTERLKGSYPYVITDPNKIIDHLNTDVSRLLLEYKDSVSRVSSRYFVFDITELANLFPFKCDNFLFSIEAIIPLKHESLYWVWIGTTTAKRRTGTKTKQILTEKLKQSQTIHMDSDSSLAKNYKIMWLVSATRLKKISVNNILENIQLKEISHSEATQIAALYKARMPIYVAGNDDPQYIYQTVAESADTTLLALFNSTTGIIDAVIANEYTQYPYVFPDGTKKSITICESNDWIKKRELPTTVFLEFLKISLQEAQSHNPHCIETECVPEAFICAYNANFKFAGILERTSHMKTDGKNVELEDEEIPEYYRKFNSLFLFYQ